MVNVLLARSPSEHLPALFLGLGGIVFLAIVGVVVAITLRKRFASEDRSPLVPFTLAELKRLHHEGQLTDEEYERMKQRTLAGYAIPADAGGEEQPPEGADRER